MIPIERNQWAQAERSIFGDGIEKPAASAISGGAEGHVAAPNRLGVIIPR
jgi:hypothetical protein